MNTLRIFILSLVIALSPTFSQSQARLVINNNAYVRMDGGTTVNPIYIVIENSNANSLTTLGTGGNLVSENEYNKLRWNIGTNSGTYVLPFTSNPATTNTKFPLSLQITVAGTGSGLIDFSSYETTTDMNIPWASMVTHMTDADNVPADNSLFVADRYWLMMNNTYTTKPDVNISFGYVDNITELGGTNTITEANLVAQRWNNSSQAWEGNFSNTAIYYGSANIVTNQVVGVDIPPSEFHEAWVLVDRTSILPVELLSINGKCEDQKNSIKWSTASETNTLNYLIEKSFNGIDFFVIGNVSAAGNSSQVLEYNFIDPTSNLQLVYYRIKQMDSNGDFAYFPTISVSPCSELESNTNIYVDESNQINIDWMTETKGNLLAEVFSADGKLIAIESFVYTEGLNHHLMKVYPATGIYFIQLTTENQTYSQKIFIK